MRELESLHYKTKSDDSNVVKFRLQMIDTRIFFTSFQFPIDKVDESYIIQLSYIELEYVEKSINN